jgi:pimeloyl-ACP methyl ester carboxylesterase
VKKMPEGVLGLIERLPQRYVGDPSVRARYRITVGRVSRDVVIEDGSCRVEKCSGLVPDAEIVTDSATWHDMNDGRLSGIEAFAARSLVVRGSIEGSLHFEPLFERPDAGGLRYTIKDIKTATATISAVMAGDERAEPLILIHGLGATKASWLPVVPELARHHRVIVIDLPGFGASSKPRGSYSASWLAEHVFGLMDGLGLERSAVAGNSMGGRVAMEMAMLRPERVRAVACLCPVAAFTHRPALGLVRALRPEFGVLAGRLPRARIQKGLRDLFADASTIDDAWYEAAIDDFLTTWRSPRARMAFFCALKNIYLDEPDGDEGFWSRLAHLKTPALYIYGRRDVLITHRFGLKVQEVLPSARVLVWDDCGHVPQLEHSERTAEELLDFFATVTTTQKAG